MQRKEIIIEDTILSQPKRMGRMNSERAPSSSPSSKAARRQTDYLLGAFGIGE